MDKAVIYWVQRDCLKPDGSVYIPITTTDGSTISTGAKTIVPTNNDYQFWRWLVEGPGYRGRIDGHELEQAKLRFEFESTMTRDPQHNPDPNVNAARIVAESIAAGETPLTDDLEAARACGPGASRMWTSGG